MYLKWDWDPFALNNLNTTPQGPGLVCGLKIEATCKYTAGRYFLFNLSPISSKNTLESICQFYKTKYMGPYSCLFVLSADVNRIAATMQLSKILFFFFCSFFFVCLFKVNWWKKNITNKHYHDNVNFTIANLYFCEICFNLYCRVGKRRIDGTWDLYTLFSLMTIGNSSI